MDKYRHIIDKFMPDINVWDEKYDYVMHDDHWLSSKWSPDCEKCQAEGKKPPPPPPTVTKSTNNNVRANVVNGATMTETKIKPVPEPKPEIFYTEATMNINNTTSSPVRNSSSMDSTNDPTLKNSTIHHNNNMDISPAHAVPPPVTIAMTPIAPAHVSTRAFVTPYTGSKYGHETFNRSTRQSTKKLLSQTQDLIDLNETFDLYRSALADTPQLEHQSFMQQQPQHQQQPHQQPQQQLASSRIPKIPVRLSRP